MSVPPFIPDHVLIRPIGRGAYGEVWLARNVMGTLRAVKVVRRDAFEDARPYEREYSGVQHYEPVSRGSEALVHILHVGRDDAVRLFYYVMELADDEDPETTVFRRGNAIGDPNTYVPRTLRAELRRLGRLPQADCIELAAVLAGGLNHLHRHGVVHRDIKPSNIIRVNGTPKLADPGLAGIADEGRTFVGTEGFVPPEGPGSVRADLYALGKVLYEASTGLDRNRFPEIPADWIGAQDSAERMEFHEIVLRACEGDPRRRYPDAGTLAADIALLRSGRSVRALRRLERRAATLRLVAGVAAVLLAIAGSAWWTARREAVRERALRNQVSVAEQNALGQLQRSWIAQARAARLAGGFGARSAALQALDAAAVIQPGIRADPDWQQERIAARAHWEAAWSPLPGNEGRVLDPMMTVLDSGQGWLAIARPDGGIRRISLNNTASTQLPPPGGLPDQLMELSEDGRWIRARTGETHYIGNLESGRWTITNGICALMPDGVSWVRFGSDHRLERVSLLTGETGRPWALDPEGTTRWSVLSPSPNGRRVAAADSESRRIVLWDPESGEVSEVLRSPTVVASLAWSNSGDRLVAGCLGGQVLVWSLPDTEPVWEATVHAGTVRSVCLDREGLLVFTGGDDETVHLLDASGGIELGSGGFTTWGARFSPDGSTLAPVAFGGSNGVLRITPPVGLTRSRPRSAGPTPGALAWSPDGTILFTASEPALQAWDVRGRTVGDWNIPEVDHLGCDGAFLWFRNRSGVGRLSWSAGSTPVQPIREGAEWSGFGLATKGRPPVFANATTERLVFEDGRTADGFLERIRKVVQAGPWIAAGSATASNIVVWSARDGTRVRELPSSPGAIPGMDASGRWLVVTDRRSFLWDTRDWSSRALTPSGIRPPAALDPEGRFLAIGIREREVQLLRLPGLELHATLEAPGGSRLIALGLANGARHVGALTIRGDVLIWDVDAVLGPETR